MKEKIRLWTCSFTRVVLYQHNFQEKKNRKWIWSSPDGTVISEIDLITTKGKRIVNYVSVINKSDTSSNQMLVRVSISVNIKEESKIINENLKSNMKLIYQHSEARKSEVCNETEKYISSSSLG